MHSVHSFRVACTTATHFFTPYLTDYRLITRLQSVQNAAVPQVSDARRHDGATPVAQARSGSEAGGL